MCAGFTGFKHARAQSSNSSLNAPCAGVQDEHMGADFSGVPSMVQAAGGAFVAMYAEIGVGVAVSRDASFSSKVFAADSRLHAVSACAPWQGMRG